MDQRLCLRTAHRRLARPAHAPRPYLGDEWRELSAQAKQAASAYCDRRDGTVASLGGSGGNRRLRLRIVGWVEFLSVARTKRTIVDGAANLEEEIGPSPRPAHVLRFVHPPIDQEIGRPLRDRGTNPQAGTVPLGVIDHPVALAGEIAIQRVQGGP